MRSSRSVRSLVDSHTEKERRTLARPSIYESIRGHWHERNSTESVAKTGNKPTVRWYLYATNDKDDKARKSRYVPNLCFAVKRIAPHTSCGRQETRLKILAPLVCMYVYTDTRACRLEGLSRLILFLSLGTKRSRKNGTFAAAYQDYWRFIPRQS